MNSNISRALMRITPRPDAIMLRGHGSYLWDDRGVRYLDFVQGWAVNALGHSPAELRRALNEQAAKPVTASPAYYNAPELALAERVVELSGLARAHFANSGAEANEAAVKIARKWGRLTRGGAYEIVTTHGAFHGRTLAMMAASGKPGWDELFPPAMPGFLRVAHGDLNAVRRAITPLTVAVMTEPIQGEAGVIVPEPSYLRGLRALADENDLLLIFDEVQTGMGRTGKLFAFEHDGVRPDILTLGKGLGSGFPLSAVLCNARANCLSFGDQGGTYSGNPLAAAVGLAVVDTISKPEFLQNVVERGHELATGLDELARACNGRVRGVGLLQALEFAAPVAERVRDDCFARGLLVNAARPQTLRFMPQLRVTSSEVVEMLSLLKQCLPC